MVDGCADDEDLRRADAHERSDHAGEDARVARLSARDVDADGAHRERVSDCAPSRRVRDDGRVFLEP